MRWIRGEIADPGALFEKVVHIGRHHDCIVQAVDARYVAGEEHLEHAVKMTLRALERETAIADDPAMELLLYIAGTRQIDRAIEIGVNNGTGEVVIVAVGDSADAAIEEASILVEETESDLHGDQDAIQEWFDITDAERRATTANLSELVTERVVLLQLEA